MTIPEVCFSGPALFQAGGVRHCLHAPWDGVLSHLGADRLPGILNHPAGSIANAGFTSRDGR